MKILAQFVAGCILTPLIDYVWLGLIMKQFYLREMGPIMRMENGVFSPLLGAAGVVYVLISAGILVFVLPQTDGQFGQSFIYGGIFGLVAYGIYDFTNLSTLQNWSLKLSLADMAWGGVICGIIAVAMTWIGQKLA